MTLDEAIAKAKADGDVQLAEWLRQARGADAAARWYTEKLRDAHRTIRKLLNENAKLREFASELLVGVCDACAFPPCDECEVYATARKLGVEVRKLDVPDD
jgi:hypothetical protein